MSVIASEEIGIAELAVNTDLVFDGSSPSVGWCRARQCYLRPQVKWTKCRMRLARGRQDKAFIMPY